MQGGVSIVEENIDQKTSGLEEIKRKRVLKIDRRCVNIGGSRRLEDKTNKILVDLQNIIEGFIGPPEEFYVERVNRYEDAIYSTKRSEFDFLVFYKLLFDKNLDVSHLIEDISEIVTRWTVSPYYLILYRSKDSNDFEADTCFARYSQIRNEEECKSPIERAIFRCFSNSISGKFKNTIFVGELNEGRVSELVRELPREMMKHESNLLVYENSNYLEIKRKKRVFDFFKH